MSDESERRAVIRELRCEEIDDTLRKYPDRRDFVWSTILSLLLDERVIHLNRFHWMYEWPEEARHATALCVNCNDVFMWGCADASEATVDELVDVYQHWRKDPGWGPAVWCIKKRKMMPQKPVEDAIREGGVWNLDEMGLDENGYEKHMKEREREKSEGISDHKARGDRGTEGDD